ncbi:MAG: sulfotransferase [Actinomycetota bacterium]
MDGGRRIRVLYIGGWGRSGSTLLERMLGQIPGVVATGEVREIWQRGLQENRACGCGERFLECAFWTSVGNEAYGGWDRVDLERLLDLRFSLDRPWSYPELRIAHRATPVSGRVGEYEQHLVKLYRGISTVSGADVIVDSSKIPTHGFLLAGTGVIDLRVLHLVRDSRGVAFSWAKRVEKKVPGQDPYFLPRYGPFGSAIRWDVYNLMATRLRRPARAYAKMRYEDLIRDPEAKLDEILHLAGLDVQPGWLTFLQEGSANLHVDHTVDGNPVRWAKGPIELRADEEWKQRMSRSDRALVTVLTAPMLSAYRYRLGAGK